MKLNISKYEVVVGYGIGEYYERHKSRILQIVKPNYLSDRKWEDTTETEYDGIPIIRKAQMDFVRKALVVIMVCNKWQEESIRINLLGVNADIISITDFLQKEITITGKELKEGWDEGRYEDEQGNRIRFDETVSDNITICFGGGGNFLEIGKDVAVTSLRIRFGRKGNCMIGAGTELLGDSFFVSGASLTIGKDCLIAGNVTIMTYNGHHIFDLHTKKRVSRPQDIEIGNQIWIARGVTLLGGAWIGDGSVVGAGSVTSGRFGDHLIIAGSPARVVRRDICWSKDSEEYCDHAEFGQCIDQAAMRYL